MCSLAAMPADYEMLVSHSPPVFSHSPPISADFLSNYANYRVQSFLLTPPLARRSTPPPSTLALSLAPAQSPKTDAMPAAAPRRPCLVVRAEDAASPSEEGDLPSPTRLKKKVVFADDKGLSLTQVRVMTEPSNVPPMWSCQFLAQVTKGITAEVAPEPWEVTFPQPASDYLHFRHRLDTANVSLENVIVRESEDVVVGTVKVRNLCFHKVVMVRSSSDDWLTHEDAFCTYVPNTATPAMASAYVLYDTFSFRLTLPPRSRRIEFCVCFRAESDEYWDNNGGKNYVLLKKNSDQHPAASLEESRPAKSVGKCSDALHAKLDAWSEFASWNHLVNDTPYW